MGWIVGIVVLFWILEAIGLFRIKLPERGKKTDPAVLAEMERQARLRARATALAEAEAREQASKARLKQAQIAADKQEAQDIVNAILKKYDVEPVDAASAPLAAVTSVDTAIVGEGELLKRPSSDEAIVARSQAVPPVPSTPVMAVTPTKWPVRSNTKVADVVLAKPNVSGGLDMLLFDLDDTLLATQVLEGFRGRQHVGEQGADYVNALRSAAERLTVLFPQSLLRAIQQSHPSLRLGVWTRAPRVYTLTLLSVCFPLIHWDAIVAFEDIPDGEHKPHPDGLLIAARLAGLSDMARIAMIGDESLDLIGAYQAGALAVLSTVGWGRQWAAQNVPERRQHYASLGYIPDAQINHPDELLQFVVDPGNFLPALESWHKSHHGMSRTVPMRVDVRRHFFSIDGVTPAPSIDIHFLGRYFKAHHTNGRFNFRRRAALHPLNEALLDAKRGFPYPESWADCCARYILDYADALPMLSLPLLVCAIPSSSQVRGAPGTERMLGLLEQIRSRLISRPDIVFRAKVFEFSAGVMQNKALNQSERMLNVGNHLKVTDTTQVSGRAVLVLDDVATSGATMYFAAQYLRVAGASSVRCVTLAHTLS